MQKKFIINLAIVLILNLLIKPFFIFGIDREVQIAVGSEVYGSYYALLNFTFLLNIVLDLGITNFNNKNIAQNNHLLEKHLSSIILLRLALAGVYISVTFLIGWLVNYSFMQLKMLFILALNQILISFIFYLRSNIAGLHFFKTDSIISILDRLILISICGFLLWGNITTTKFQLSWFIYAQTLSYILTALITFVIIWDKAKIKRLKWDYLFSLMILKKSYPYAVLVLLMTFYNRIDTVMLERLLPDGARQSGIYASAYRMLDAANMIAFLFAGLLLPMFAKMIKLKENTEDLVRLAFTLLVIPAMIVGVGSYFYRAPLIELLYKENLIESARVFGILMFCFVAISTTYIFSTLLTANGNLKELNILAGAGICINICLNIWLIPKYKAAGSAMVSLTTQFVIALVQVILVQRIFKFRINYRFLCSIAFFFIGVIGIGFGSQRIHYNPHNWILNFVCMVALSFIFAFSLRVLSIKSIYKTLKGI
jgi:O-antigen/teichoic acid export membrane protein